MKSIQPLTSRQAAYPHYRAPHENGAKLLLPAWDHLADSLQQSRAGEDNHDFCGRTQSELRAVARRECVELARRYTGSYADVAVGNDDTRPLVVTGHQPGLVHPGVWLKNFAAGELAGQTDALALSLIVDNDVCPAPSIRVPTGKIEAPHVALVPFDAPTLAVPYEQRRLVDCSLWDSFGKRVQQHLGGLVKHPLLETWWPRVVDSEEPLLGLRLAQARHRTELAWGNRTLELPQSLVCQSEAFRWFACTLLARLPEFSLAYNQSLADYRAAHHLRNQAQPLPDLSQEEDWREAPFWLWTDDAPERRPLFARQRDGVMEVTNRDGFEKTLPIDSRENLADAVQTLAEWERRGVKLRSRALTTTLFARMFLADLFLHGIGGGKYDQVTDRICTTFFETAPAPFGVLSGTLHLPIKHPQGDASDVRREQTLLRRLKFHPERHLDVTALPSGEAEVAMTAMEQKRSAIGTPKTVANASERHEEIVAANRRLRPLLESQREAAQGRLALAKRRAKANTLLESREYAFCLYTRDALEKFLLDFRGDLS